MSIKLVIDMNLSPDWVPVLNDHGWQAIHWSAIGDPRASDRTERSSDSCAGCFAGPFG